MYSQVGIHWKIKLVMLFQVGFREELSQEVASVRDVLSHLPASATGNQINTDFSQLILGYPAQKLRAMNIWWCFPIQRTICVCMSLSPYLPHLSLSTTTTTIISSTSTITTTGLRFLTWDSENQKPLKIKTFSITHIEVKFRSPDLWWQTWVEPTDKRPI